MNKKNLNSNKSFGILFFVVFLIIAFYPLINEENIRIWSTIIAIIFLILGLINSKLLTPLNKAWIKLGILLGNFGIVVFRLLSMLLVAVWWIDFVSPPVRFNTRCIAGSLLTGFSMLRLDKLFALCKEGFSLLL